MMVQETTEIVVVDLDYEISSDKEERSVTFKFSNFQNEAQMEKFKNYMKDNLPLLLFTSDVQH